MPRAKKTSICLLGGSGVGGEWMFWITYHLLSGPKRFGELQRLLPQASRQMLTIQLRQLEQVGMIHRQVYAVTPSKVEYQLSALGKTSEPILRQLSAWARSTANSMVGRLIGWSAWEAHGKSGSGIICSMVPNASVSYGGSFPMSHNNCSPYNCGS